MIPLRFALFHSGGKLSYLRALTFASLRHFHPTSEITLFTTDRYNKKDHNWQEEIQDFETDISGVDYKGLLPALDVSVVTLKNFCPNEHPIYQADLFRWWWLTNFGGFYLDTDQIILRSFDNLPRSKDFIYSHYDIPSCGDYYPVGVLGSVANGLVASCVHNIIPRFRNPDDYNSTGPWMFREMAKNLPLTEENSFNAPSNYFYPIPESFQMDSVFDGTFEIPKSSYALHWFGGLPRSQRFNRGYHVDFALHSDDTISKIVRELNIQIL